MKNLSHFISRHIPLAYSPKTSRGHQVDEGLLEGHFTVRQMPALRLFDAWVRI